MKNISEIKKESESKISKLQKKRKLIIGIFKKTIEEVKINQIRDSILNKE